MVNFDRPFRSNLLSKYSDFTKLNVENVSDNQLCQSKCSESGDVIAVCSLNYSGNWNLTIHCPSDPLARTECSQSDVCYFHIQHVDNICDNITCFVNVTETEYSASNSTTLNISFTVTHCNCTHCPPSSTGIVRLAFTF